MPMSKCWTEWCFWVDKWRWTSIIVQLLPCRICPPIRINSDLGEVVTLRNNSLDDTNGSVDIWQISKLHFPQFPLHTRHDIIFIINTHSFTTIFLCKFGKLGEIYYNKKRDHSFVTTIELDKMETRFRANSFASSSISSGSRPSTPNNSILYDLLTQKQNNQQHHRIRMGMGEWYSTKGNTPYLPHLQCVKLAK